MTFPPRRRPGEFFPVVIGKVCRAFQTRSVSAMFCAGMVLGSEFHSSVVFPNKEKYRGGTKQLYGVWPGRVPTPGRLRPAFPFSGECWTSRPRNLSVPRAGQANRRARSPKGDASTAAVLGRIESDPRRGRRRSIRIGSVQNRLGTWAASAGSSRSKILGHRRGGQSKAMRSSLWHTRVVAGSCPRSRLTGCARSIAPPFDVQLATPGRGWVNCCP